MKLMRPLLALVAFSGVFPGFAAALPQPAVQPSPQELTQKLDTLHASVGELIKKVDDTKGWTTKDVLTSIGGIAAVILAVIAAINVWVALRVSHRTLTMSANEKRAIHIQENLDKFYGPLRQLRNQSTLLYKAFKATQPNPDSFRTLTVLLSGTKFEGNEKSLLDEIIKIGKETETLIKSSSGLVDEDLQPILGQASTHYLVLRLAHEGLLKGDADKYAEYVFPLNLDSSVDAKVAELKAELTRLRTVS